jgi:hypothetical protein
MRAPRERRTWLAMLMVALVVCGALAVAGAGAATGAEPAATSTSTTAAAAPPPANDDRDSAQPLGALPATVSGTTAGSTLEPTEPSGDCEQTLAGSVWYSVSFASTAPTSTGVQLNAGGNLDACVDVFTMQRSQDLPVTAAETDKNGLARLTFAPQANTTYLIRVGQLFNSDPGTFTLSVFSVASAAAAPGTPLPTAGARGNLDSFFTTTAAYSVPLTAAVTYKLNLVDRAGSCMQLSIYAPHTTDFSSATPVAEHCGGYRLFTPTVSGRYSLLISAARGLDVEQPYALVVAPASSLVTAPGVPLPNLSTVRARLRGNVDSAVRLYRLDVTSRSQLTLTLDAASFSQFDLELVASNGRVVDCQCGSSGDQTIQAVTRPGIYYAAVKAEDFSYGKFSLSRQSRTITGLRVAIDGHHYVPVSFGAAVVVAARIRPAISGEVGFELEYFDPLAGWQYRGEVTEPLIDGLAEYVFTPPDPGRWRATAAFAGTRVAAPSQTGYAYLAEIPPPGD